MNLRTAQQALSQYRTIEVEAGAATASPHRVVQMLFGGVLDRIARAKGALLRGDRPAKGKDIGAAIDIVSALQGGLDLPQGGALAANLAALYDYMIRCLLEANRANDAGKLDEVAALVGEIKAGWDGIAAEVLP
ncbi:MAG: flagellar export chaperone FliS [Pseudomonadales bacterium]|nr:flagellar export chaperone FliS [Pseudomonadales bacterium]